ncbi:MAG: DUF3160 domain-containing protein [Anaerolineae bacterium]|nr:DUF3160 domain-containing protein [Anaerolineae bacterium]
MNKRLAGTIIWMVVLLLGCGLGSTPAPAPATPGPPQRIEVGMSVFAPYEPIPVEVVAAAPDYTPDLSALDRNVYLSDAQRATLETNGFVVVPEGYKNLYSTYVDAKEYNIPIFVSTDAVLHTFHILYDNALRTIEENHLIGDLESLSTAMLAAAQADYAATSGAVQEAARQNMAFFAVATRLLDPGATIPDPVRDWVDQELALIDAHAGFVQSPIFGYWEDYSQYVPRGHYTRNEDLQRYFQAMMWYGRMSFHLRRYPEDPTAARRETRGALMIVRAIYNSNAGNDPALDVWDRIYEPTAFFVGATDDLTVYDYARVAQEVYGGLPDPATLADEAQIESFISAAQQLRKPAIAPMFVTTSQGERVEYSQGFRFMGQRFVPDSYILQELVFGSREMWYLGSAEPFTMVQTEGGDIRGFPRGLDVPAALGSARGLEILTAEGDTEYRGYAEQLAKLQGEFAALSTEQWTGNLYWSWLHTLRPLLEVKGEGYPFFMRAPAWVDKDLHTWLGSWTELRHDTILLAKQSATTVVVCGRPEPEATRGYVEPQPEVYARLAALTAQMQTGLHGRGLLSESMEQKLDRMEELALALKIISEKELRGEGLTEQEYTLIRDIGDTLEGLAMFPGKDNGSLNSESDERVALVADVHTDWNTAYVLEEGVGDAFTIYVVVLVEGKQIVARGSVFSYYEFKWPADNRLTDEAWRALSPRPGRPAWTASFIISE